MGASECALSKRYISCQDDKLHLKATLTDASTAKSEESSRGDE